MKKGPDLVLILVLVFVIGFVITGVSQTGFVTTAIAAGVAQD